MAIEECKYELDMTTQAPEDTIEWFHWVFLAHLAILRAYEGMPQYHPMLVEQHMTVLRDAARVTATSVKTMTIVNNLLA